MGQLFNQIMDDIEYSGEQWDDQQLRFMKEVTWWTSMS